MPANPDRASWLSFALVWTGLALFFAAVAKLYFRQYKLSTGSEAALYLCLMSLVTLAIAPACSATRSLIGSRMRQPLRTLCPILACTFAYLIYALAAGDFRWPAIARLLALCCLPALVYAAAPVRDLSRLTWQDALVWTGLVLVMIFREWKGIWNVPANLDFMARLFFIAVASWTWVFVRPVPGIGYSIAISRRTARAAFLNFLCFAIVAIPLSMTMHFAAWNNRWRGIEDFCIGYVEIFIFIAWLEELLFRGFLQSLLTDTWNRPGMARLTAALAFGFSHILLAPAPNWRYVILASIAGWFYGTAFRQGGNLMAPALTHALVDTAWRTWFGGRG